MSDDKSFLIIHSDGGARGNPGPAGIGAVLEKDDGSGNQVLLEEISKYIGESTNNFAEYTALLTGLEHAAEFGLKQVRCYLDSELVVKQLNGQYKIKEPTLQVLAQKVLKIMHLFDSVTFTHVPREKNSHADKLVNQAIDQALAK